MIEVIIIVVIIVLLFILTRKPSRSKNNVKLSYEDLVGHQNDKITEILAENLENKKDKTMGERYDLYRLNLYNRQNLDEARRNLDDILDNLTNTQVVGGNVPDFGDNDIVFHIFNDINHVIAPYRLPDTILDNNAHNKRENIDITHQTDKREISNIYFNETPVHNDPQNVHETEINRFYRDKFETIVRKNRDESNLTNLDTLPIYILNMGDESKKYRAQKTYASMMGDAPISSLNSSEGKVLTEVWKRIHSDENKDRKKELIISLLDQLADATEKSIDGKYHVVCTSGRCLRTLDSLTLLDADEIISNPPKTKEIIRKEIFESASGYLETYLEKNPEMSELYDKPEIDLTDSENKKVSEFVEKIKAGFAEKIHRDYKNSGISPDTIDTILVEANVGF